LGKELGVSKERVRQLEARAMEKLKASMVTKIDTPDDLFGTQ
jgi:RNA polymerase sigma-32 factor